MKIHLISDVHVEHGNPEFPSVSSDVVVLAGDIGMLARQNELIEYLKKVADTTNNVIWVLGNHEFYGMNYYDALDTAEDIADKLGISLLDVAARHSSVKIDGIKFWGSTLWSDVKDGDYFTKQRVKQGINDFHVIKDFNIDKMCEINYNTVKQINWGADVIVTHFPPVKLPSRFGFSELTYYFYNFGLEEKVCNSKAKYWMYGHTHESYNKDVDGTIVVSNQQGYDLEHSHYDPRFLVECQKEKS